MILGALIAVAAVFALFRVMAWEWGLRFIGLVAAMWSALIERVVVAVLAL